MTVAFKYEAFTRAGDEAHGEVIATSEAEVREQLAQRELLVLSVKKAGVEGLAAKELRLRRDRVRPKDVAWIARNLATTQEAGLPVFRALGLLAGQKAGTAAGGLLADTQQRMADGSSLSATFRAHEPEVGALTCAFVEAGEASGRLGESFSRLADMLERRIALRRKIISAAAYPVIVLCMTLALATAMLVFVMPTFEQMYAQLGGSLPLPTQIVMSLSTFVRKTILILPFAIAGTVWAIRTWLRTPVGKAVCDTRVLRLPLVGEIARQTATVRFALTMSSLLDAGVGLLEALRLTAAATDNHVYSSAIERTAERVREGRGLAQAMAEERAAFPEVLVQLVRVGEETGTVPDLLGRLAKTTQEEVETRIDGLTNLLEPILIVALGAIVGGLLLAMYLPMIGAPALVEGAG